MGILPDVIASHTKGGLGITIGSGTGLDARTKALVYEWFIHDVQDGIGQLTPVVGEDVAELIESLQEAATSLSVKLVIWQAGDRIYFAIDQVTTPVDSGDSTYAG